MARSGGATPTDAKTKMAGRQPENWESVARGESGVKWGTRG